MAEYEHSLEAAVSADAVWELYADPTSWPSWDSGVERVELDGPLATGVTGRFTPRGAEALPFTVIQAEANRGFTDEFAFPGAVLRGTHTITPLGGGRTRITHRMELTGPDAEQLAPELMPGITDDIPLTVAALALAAAAAQRSAPAAPPVG